MNTFDDPKKLYFFFDFISHNAWLAWHQLPPLLKKHGLTLQPVPVLFAALLGAYGQKGPAEVPAKLRWMLWNVLRKAEQHGIPIAPPHTHPFNPLLPLRACCALDGSRQIKLIDRLFHATWAEGKAVASADVIAAEAHACDLDVQSLLTAAATEPVKACLRDNTEAAIRAGVFGVPTMLVRGELFWGFDDLVHLDQFLDGRDPLPADRSRYAAWTQVRPSAERRQ